MGRRLRSASVLFSVLAALTVPIQALAGEQVPLKGSETGQFSLTPGGVCPAGSLQIDVAGSGNATHIGDYTVAARECLNPTTLLVFSGGVTIAAANGDTIIGTYSGEVSITAEGVLTYEHDVEITGGTGRFAEASGSYHANGLLTGPDTYSQTLAGTVSSPGAAKP